MIFVPVHRVDRTTNRRDGTLASLEEVWSRLAVVQTLRFEARGDVVTGWNGIGTGTVRVSKPSPDVLLFTEEGTWQTTGGAALRFTNVFRWTANRDSLRLEHLRFGHDHPVYLFDLAPNDEGIWRECSPHLCREDAYTASLTAHSAELDIAWTVQGPNKQQSIRYSYR